MTANDDPARQTEQLTSHAPMNPCRTDATDSTFCAITGVTDLSLAMMSNAIAGPPRARSRVSRVPDTSSSSEVHRTHTHGKNFVRHPGKLGKNRKPG